MSSSAALRAGGVVQRTQIDWHRTVAPRRAIADRAGRWPALCPEFPLMLDETNYHCVAMIQAFGS